METISLALLCTIVASIVGVICHRYDPDPDPVTSTVTVPVLP